MNSTKILFTDLDDTLLNTQKQITPENQAAIEAALKQGHHIVLNSGRPIMGITAQIDTLGLNQKGCYAIAYNGGLIYDCYSKETIFKQSISLEDVQYIFKKAEQYELFCQTYDSTQLLAPRDSDKLQTYVRKIGVPYTIDPQCPGNLAEEPVKVLVIGEEDRKKSDAYRQEMAQWGSGRISLFYSSQTYLEHVALGVSKGNAMKQLCQHLHIPLENTVAAGDAENDIPMLETAQVGAAVANATDQVKSVANYISERDCNHSAVAEIIEKYILS